MSNAPLEVRPSAPSAVPTRAGGTDLDALNTRLRDLLGVMASGRREVALLPVPAVEGENAAQESVLRSSA